MIERVQFRMYKVANALLLQTQYTECKDQLTQLEHSGKIVHDHRIQNWDRDRPRLKITNNHTCISELTDRDVYC